MANILKKWYEWAQTPQNLRGPAVRAEARRQEMLDKVAEETADRRQAQQDLSTVSDIAASQSFEDAAGGDELSTLTGTYKIPGLQKDPMANAWRTLQEGKAADVLDASRRTRLAPLTTASETAKMEAGIASDKYTKSFKERLDAGLAAVSENLLKGAEGAEAGNRQTVARVIAPIIGKAAEVEKQREIAANNLGATTANALLPGAAEHAQTGQAQQTAAYKDALRRLAERANMRVPEAEATQDFTTAMFARENLEQLLKNNVPEKTAAATASSADLKNAENLAQFSLNLPNKRANAELTKLALEELTQEEIQTLRQYNMDTLAWQNILNSSDLQEARGYIKTINDPNAKPQDVDRAKQDLRNLIALAKNPFPSFGSVAGRQLMGQGSGTLSTVPNSNSTSIGRPRPNAESWY